MATLSLCLLQFITHLMPNHTNCKILAVDDEELIVELLKFNLESEGYSVDTALSAEDALRMNLQEYDLAILDVMMGKMSGLDLAHRMKQSPVTADIPIIFCSAKGNEEDKIAGLMSGADDYIVKPFSMRELVVRTQAILSRRGLLQPESSDSTTLSYNGLSMDLEKRTVTIDGIPTAFTRTEFDILALFLQNRNRLFSRSEIFKAVWSNNVVVSDRTIDVNISRIRKKLGCHALHLVNRSGFGYGFME